MEEPDGLVCSCGNRHPWTQMTPIADAQTLVAHAVMSQIACEQQRVQTEQTLRRIVSEMRAHFVYQLEPIRDWADQLEAATGSALR